MGRKMPSIQSRRDSSVKQFKVRVPADIRGREYCFPVVISLAGFNEDSDGPIVVVPDLKREHVAFSLKTRDPLEGRKRNATALAHLEAFYAALRAGPRPLSQKQVVALSGEVYRLIVERFDEDPGSPEAWMAWKAFNRAAREGRITTAPRIAGPDLDQRAVQAHQEAAQAAFGNDLTQGVDANPRGSHDSLKALEDRFGMLVDWVLCRHGVVTCGESRSTLLAEIERAATDAGVRMKRAARGDYSPDPVEARFPAYVPSTVQVDAPRSDKANTPEGERLTMSMLLERWAAERKPAPATLTNRQSHIKAFTKHFGDRDVNTITPKDMVAWKDALVASGLKAKTINDGHLASARALLTFGVRNHLVGSNPATGIAVSTRRQAGDGRLPYTNEEAFKLLAIARGEQSAAKRWLPWLCAYTGARVGELAQLWGRRVRQDGETWVIDIAPAEDGGTLKNVGSERTVPLHPILIEQGFLHFVRATGDGPLFYGSAEKRARHRGTNRAAREKDKPGRRHASKGVTNALATWIRGKGFDDPRKAPSHSLRHWTKTALQAAGVADSIADALQGHVEQSAAGGYRHAGLATLLAAVEKLPVLHPLPSVSK